MAKALGLWRTDLVPCHRSKCPATNPLPPSLPPSPSLLLLGLQVNALRLFKPAHAISTVLRDQKAERAIKAILLLNSMRSQFGDTKKQMESVQQGDFTVTPEQRREIEATFDMFDRYTFGAVLLGLLGFRRGVGGRDRWMESCAHPSTITPNPTSTTMPPLPNQ